MSVSIFTDFSLQPSYFLVPNFPTLILYPPFSENPLTELEEPDLAKYAAIDMAALKDVNQLGADHLSAVEAILHNTPEIQPGYLPEREATTLLMGSMHLMTLASYLDSCSVQLKCEALGGIQMALAGSPPNCLYSLLKANFGYAPSSTSPATEDSEPSLGSKRPAPSAPEIPTNFQSKILATIRLCQPSEVLLLKVLMGISLPLRHPMLSVSNQVLIPDAGLVLAWQRITNLERWKVMRTIPVPSPMQFHSSSEI